jgi:hypothetical protein
VESVLVLALQSLIFSVVTGSSPYNYFKGVNFVTLRAEVLWLHTALSNSSAHLPFFIMAMYINAFTFSTAPLYQG